MQNVPLPLLAVLAACLSSTLGGSAIVATRFVVPEAGVLPTILLRFVGASVLMLAFTLPRMPVRVATRHVPMVVGLGLVQFAVFPWFFTMSLAHIPAARAALVLSMQPLFTLAIAAMVGRERFTVTKVLGGAVSFFLWIWALEHTAPSRVALAVTLNPVSAAVLGALVLDEPVTWRLLVGLVGIVAALVLVNWSVLRRAIKAPGLPGRVSR